MSGLEILYYAVSLLTQFLASKGDGYLVLFVELVLNKQPMYVLKHHAEQNQPENQASLVIVCFISKDEPIYKSLKDMNHVAKLFAI